MKLSQTLLSAILAGITMSTVVSCTKDKEMSNAQAEKEKAKEKNESVPFNCPACGMG